MHGMYEVAGSRATATKIVRASSRRQICAGRCVGLVYRLSEHSGRWPLAATGVGLLI